MSNIKFGWHMPSFPVDGSSGAELVTQMIDTLSRIQGNFTSAWADDHFHPWGAWQSPDTAALECATTIAYLAAKFPDMHFGSSVLCQSFRNPALTAKMAANLQLLTGGRFILGIGAGWMEEEYRAYNYDYPRPSVRIGQLHETVQIIRKMWTQSPASFEGTYYRIDNAYCEPKPDPIPPILIGGGGEQLTLRVVAKYADWWNIPGASVESYAHKLNVLRMHCDAVGRDYDEIVKTYSAELVAVAETESEARRIAETTPYQADGSFVGTPNQVAGQLQAFIDLGVSHLIIRCVDFPNPAGIELFMEEVMPQLSS
ncbi:MAG: LLM class flavin-dependent oxidoreductase [Chloroflexi bacterium]|nr:LLM class flavin-dependent oxidoreductase [Chloroflexota bacterium]